MGCASPAAFIARVQGTFGDRFTVTACETLLAALENEQSGGRSDDALRAADIEVALSDDEVKAIVAIRGGAWFTRILPRINFNVLDHRHNPVMVIGFSELTTLVNIVASRTQGRGILDMGPAFLTYGLKRYAEIMLGLNPGPSSEAWMRNELLLRFDEYFADVLSMIEGRGTVRKLVCQSAAMKRNGFGRLPDEFTATFVGGNLCVLSTMLGSPYREAVDPSGRWIVIEDLNEKPERIDRFLAHLTLAGFWERCEGILIGDFHRKEQVLTPAVVTLLAYHLPRCRKIPVLTTNAVGHIWPMAPLRLNEPSIVKRTSENVYEVTWSA